MRRTGRLVVSLCTALATFVALTAPATSAPAPADYCKGQCADILPPGSNGNATATQILADKLLGLKPPHTDDQLGTYAALADGYRGLSDAQLGRFFHDSAFGVPPDQVESVLRPGGRTDVTITRDRHGIPHVNGTTRAGTMYGAGYAAAQDRLWMMDVFRHIGRGQLSGFAGGAEGNRALEQQFYQQGAYQPGDFQAQVDRVRTSGPRGQQAYTDILNYLGGLNQYIAHSRATLTFPGEYDLTGNANILTGEGIQPFQPSDLLAIGTVISALFGSGGGNQVGSALVKQAAEKRYGTVAGDRVWQAFRMENDPEARTTLHSGQTFPYAASPANPQGVAMPDPGSLRGQQLVFDPTGSAAGQPSTQDTKQTAVAQQNLRAHPQLATARGTLDDGVLPANLFSAKHGMSNALVVSAAHTASGHPVAVFGPQTGYFEPQLLMLEELQGPGISARGAAFAGLNFYVQLGRGVDYSWSATSAGQTMVDTFAVPLCNTDGSPATVGSSGYLDHGTCRAMEPIERDNAWSPTIADSTAAGSYKLIAFRTAYGIVQSRATVGGKPVAYTTLRSTYQHEADTLIGFQMFNDPSAITGPAQFQQAASHIGYTFNWFYVDSAHTAYYNSGLNPTRAPNVDPNLPVWGLPQYEWRNWDQATNTVANTPFAAHPNSIDQDYYVSWNNKIAKGYTSSGYGVGAVHRANLLDDRVRALVAKGGVTRAALVGAMEDAALTDLRAEDVLPLLLTVIGSAPVTDPKQAGAVRDLSVWLGHGGKRTETTPGSKTYADANAVRILDAWWPLLAKAVFGPGFGDDLYGQLSGAAPVDEAPSAPHQGQGHQGSSFLGGWWSYVQRDLRAVLGRPVAGGPGITFCGGGNLGRCRAALLSSLTAAANTPATTQYPGDANCKAGDQWCADAIIQRPLGGLTVAPIGWQNRPTFQQVVEYPAHRP